MHLARSATRKPGLPSQFRTVDKEMVAAVQGGQIYTSVDYGETWVGNPATDFREWAAVAMASGTNGQKLVARGTLRTDPRVRRWRRHLERRAVPGVTGHLLRCRQMARQSWRSADDISYLRLHQWG